MAVKYRYISCHPVTRVQLSNSLLFSDPSWDWVVNGNGSFTGTIAVPTNPQALAALRIATAKKQAAVYVRNDTTGQYVWGGPVVERSWDPEAGTITVSCVEWRAWFYWTFLAPKTDMSGDNAYGWAAVDQLQIAREIAAYAIAGGTSDGRPPLTIGSELSGRTRDLNTVGLNFKRPGELIDSMAKRDGGFEWTIECRPDTVDGLPRLYFAPYYPTQGGVIDGLVFKATPGGGNIAKYGPVKESGVDQRERQWATGAGQPPDMPFAQDSDPLLASRGILLREDVTNYSSVTDRTTLASHARAERVFYHDGNSTMDIVVGMTNPDVSKYGVGDRGRLVLQDRWLNWDLPAVRILHKKVRPRGNEVDLTLDLSDYKLPDVDTGGVV